MAAAIEPIVPSPVVRVLVVPPTVSWAGTPVVTTTSEERTVVPNETRAALAACPDPLLYARVDLVEGDAGPLVMEVELTEPSLYLVEQPSAANTYAEAVLRWG